MMRSAIGRQAVMMWLAGFAGVVVIAVGVVPALVAGKPLPLPVWAVSLVAAVQSGVLLALAVWSGLSLAPRVGLRAPLFEAIATAMPPGRRCVRNGCPDYWSAWLPAPCCWRCRRSRRLGSRPPRRRWSCHWPHACCTAASPRNCCCAGG